MVVARIAVEMDYPTFILALPMELHLASQVTRPASFCSLDFTPHYVHGNPGMMVVLPIVLL